MSVSMINAATCAREKVSCDTLDSFFASMRRLEQLVDGPKRLWKADIDAAFRRIPIRADHRKYAQVVLQVGEDVLTAQHLTMMFGSVASVSAWHRVACLLRALARRLLMLPVLTYVDDYLAIDLELSAAGSMQSFARLVRLCLGPSAVANRKLECGNPLVVLGVECSLCSKGATFWPSADKVRKWIATIVRFLADMRMTGGEASKLSGQLQWATQSTFSKLGRALLRPIIEHIRARSSAVSPQLALALRWWLEVLELDLRTTRTWSGNGGRQVHLFSDARSVPPRLGAVLFMDGQVFYCDAPPPEGVMACFKAREDGQIMGLEILSIALGMFRYVHRMVGCVYAVVPGISSFADLIRGRNVVIWSDNTGAEAVTRSGAARTFDHCCLVHALWKRFAELQLGIWVERVPTKVNIADDPSRHRSHTSSGLRKLVFAWSCVCAGRIITCWKACTCPSGFTRSWTKCFASHRHGIAFPLVQIGVSSESIHCGTQVFRLSREVFSGQASHFCMRRFANLCRSYDLGSRRPFRTCRLVFG